MMNSRAEVEEQPLLASPTSSTDLADVLERERREQDESEMENPWPATFERSMTLLADPLVSPALVSYATETMHVARPPLKTVTSLSDLNRGWNTPDPVSSRVAARADRIANDLVQENIFARMGIQRNPSLDWRIGRPSQAGTAETSAGRRTRALEELKLLRARRFENQGGENRICKMEDGIEKFPDTSEKASFAQCVFNMSNMLMGVGILSIPFCFKEAGYLGGTVSILIFGAVCWWTSILIGRELNGDPRPRSLFHDGSSGEQQPIRMRRTIHSFPAIAREAFGQPGAIFLSTVLYTELFSSLVLFLVSIGDHLHTIFPETTQFRQMLAVSVLLVFPTTLLKTPKLLSYFSAIGTFATIAVVLSVFSAAVWKGDIAEEVVIQNERLHSAEPIAPPYHAMLIASGLPVSFGLVAYCFGGHSIVPTVYTSMAQPERFDSMMLRSFLIVMVCNLMVGFGGYYMFGNTVLDQITLSLESAPIHAGGATSVLSWFVILTMFTKFCLYQFPLALAIEELVAPIVKKNDVMEYCYAAIKIFLIVSSLLVALYAPGFGYIAALVGLICSMSVSVIFPSAAHLKLFGSKNLPVWEVALDWLFVIGGTIFAIVGTIATVKD
eukprot:CAMPEP_0171310854 /NCGR_PEP_ID=MMETSP0816-20121228/21044_1 /TAXON_ID=420281 /ORGANISM="Proboscia inermis, Strain CCAP1064/1" /LENGTH=611 /DNA_ID=CAMNT_0011795219 /DNA_START=66 /DNA_END=1901 /DNA_ORIENTATION=+